MTERKGGLRRRRTSSVSMPKTLADWFGGTYRGPAGTSGVPWTAKVFPSYVLLPERWDAWSAANPDAKPPAGYEWLAIPGHPRRNHAPWLLAAARGCISEGSRW